MVRGWGLGLCGWGGVGRIKNDAKRLLACTAAWPSFSSARLCTGPQLDARWTCCVRCDGLGSRPDFRHTRLAGAAQQSLELPPAKRFRHALPSCSRQSVQILREPKHLLVHYVHRESSHAGFVVNVNLHSLVSNRNLKNT